MGIRLSSLGHITIDPPLNAGEREHLSAFADSRRWDRPAARTQFRRTRWQYGAAAWLEHVIDHFLRPGALASTSGQECFSESTFDHVCRGIIAMERGDVRELSLMHVERNDVTVEVLVASEGSPW